MGNSRPVSEGNPPAGVRGTPGRLLVLAVLLQAALGVYRAWIVVSELPGLAPSLLGRAGEAGAFSSLPFALALVAVATAAAFRAGGSSARRLAAAGLAGLLALAGAGLALTVAGVATGRLVPAGAWAVVALGLAAALLVPRRREEERSPAGLSAWDAATLLFLLALLVPAVFPYVHFDARAIWGCRALAVAGSGSLASLGECSHGSYPPLFSLLLALGGKDPVLGGRLVAWLLAVFSALFLRGAFARLSPRHAAAATLFVVSTGWVWVSSAMYYANVPLMAFLAGGAVLVLGEVPRARGDAAPGLPARLAGALLLAAAVLVRPDGWIYAGALGSAAAFLALGGRARPDFLPFAGAALGWCTWALRPDLLRFTNTFTEHASTWRTAGATGTEAVRRIVAVSLHVLQGLWLAHWGLGLTIWVILFAAVAALRRGRAASGATVAWGVTAFAGLATVLALYAVLPFTVDVVAGVGLDPPKDFLGSWENFARVGVGRMVVHLLPAGAFFVLAVVEDAD